MKLFGVKMDFDNIKSCGILPDMCVDFDHRFDELSENEKLLSYWNNHINDLLNETKNLVVINDESMSMVYSADNNAIELIKKHFKEMQLETIEYENINKCDYCVQHDYLQNS